MSILLFLLKTSHWLYNVCQMLLLLYLLSSWFPRLRFYKPMQVLAYYVEPFLNFFRQWIPPLGPFDLSPIFAFFFLMLLFNFLIPQLLHLLNNVLFGILG